MSKIKNSFLMLSATLPLAIASSALLTVSSCGDGGAEEVGEDLDEAIEDAGDKIEDATDKD